MKFKNTVGFLLCSMFGIQHYILANRIIRNKSNQKIEVSVVNCGDCRISKDKAAITVNAGKTIPLGHPVNIACQSGGSCLCPSSCKYKITTIPSTIKSFSEPYTLANGQTMTIGKDLTITIPPVITNCVTTNDDGTRCIACFPGKKIMAGGTSCAPCDAGTYSLDGKTCKACDGYTTGSSCIPTKTPAKLINRTGSTVTSFSIQGTCNAKANDLSLTLPMPTCAVSSIEVNSKKYSSTKQLMMVPNGTYTMTQIGNTITINGIQFNKD